MILPPASRGPLTFFFVAPLQRGESLIFNHREKGIIHIASSSSISGAQHLVVAPIWTKLALCEFYSQDKSIVKSNVIQRD